MITVNGFMCHKMAGVVCLSVCVCVGGGAKRGCYGCKYLMFKFKNIIIFQRGALAISMMSPVPRIL